MSHRSTKSPAMLINYMHYENHCMTTKCNELMEMIKTLKEEVSELNSIVSGTYDLSGSNNMCVTIDESGNFVPCLHKDLSGNVIPCVLPPMDLSGDMARQYPYGPYYPYYPIGPYYPYSPYYPYGGLYGNNYYRDFPSPQDNTEQERCGGGWGGWYPRYGYGFPYNYPWLYRDISGEEPNKKIPVPPGSHHVYPFGPQVPPSPIHYMPIPPP